jgi:hypothetical protein
MEKENSPGKVTTLMKEITLMINSTAKENSHGKKEATIKEPGRTDKCKDKEREFTLLAKSQRASLRKISMLVTD